MYKLTFTTILGLVLLFSISFFVLCPQSSATGNFTLPIQNNASNLTPSAGSNDSNLAQQDGNVTGMLKIGH